MTTRRLGVAVAVLGGYLYAIGGSDGQCPLNTVERYDSRYVIRYFCHGNAENSHLGQNSNESSNFKCI